MSICVQTAAYCFTLRRQKYRNNVISTDQSYTRVHGFTADVAKHTCLPKPHAQRPFRCVGYNIVDKQTPPCDLPVNASPWHVIVQIVDWKSVMVDSAFISEVCLEQVTHCGLLYIAWYMRYMYIMWEWSGALLTNMVELELQRCNRWSLGIGP